MHNPETSGATDIKTLMENKWRKLYHDNWVLLEKGLNTGKGSRINRVAMIHNWLSIAPDGLPYWLIGENCPDLIRTLPILVHDENTVEAWDTHQEDHAADSCSYGLSHVRFIRALQSTMIARRKVFIPFNKEGDNIGIDLMKFEEAVKKKQHWTNHI